MSDAEIQALGGGSLLIAWQLKGKKVLIVGGGEIASQRIESILPADAHIIVLSPNNGLHPRTKRLVLLRPDRITYHDRLFSGSRELDGMDMVLTALDDVDISREICQMCRSVHIPVNAADIPELCDFYFGSQIRDGPLQIMISTNGNGPRMASLIKNKIQTALTGAEGDAITKIGRLRGLLKERAPGVGGVLGRRRMRWMTKLCNEWDMDDLTQLDEEMMNKLLDEGWDKNRVPTPKEVGGHQRWKGKTSAMNVILPSTIGFVAGAACTVLLGIYGRRRGN